ncbi:Ribosomal RNA small subunit methyltransferase A [Neochlamydia sp. TUME1]|nr:Ribosomal RNA small subunit methyltransferase A [Neochlamydia sp. TUME1]
MLATYKANRSAYLENLLSFNREGKFKIMPIYRPSELHHFLNKLGVSPKKGLSQNFLIDGNITRKIVAYAALSPHDLVVEIGPGPGCLSEEIIKHGSQLLTIEKDPVMAQALQRLQTESNRLEIFCEDVLEFPLGEKLLEILKPGQKAIIVGNLPYHLTTPILIQLVKLYPYVSKVVVMVQEEVARRFTAQPGTSEYSSFTVFLNYYSTPRYAFMVRRACFHPIPNVDSAVVTLDLHQPPFVANEEDFFKMTRTAFGQRRKMMRTSLKELYCSQAVSQALLQIGRDVKSRPEELSLEDFMHLYRKLNNSV